MQYRTLLIVLAAIAALAVADSQFIGLKGKIVERRDEWKPYGFLTGDFYFLYEPNDENRTKNDRIRFEYVISSLNGTNISNLYNYEDMALYSMRGEEKCTGTKFSETPDPWWFVEGIYERTGEPDANDMYWFNSVENKTGQVKRILMKDGMTQTTLTNGYLGAIEFLDGRSVTFSEVVVDNTMSISDVKFQQISSCPVASCPIYADIIFVLDSSGSVLQWQWRKMAEFVFNVMDSFTFGKNGVYASVIQFNGETNNCPNKNLIILTEETCPGVNPNENKRCKTDWPLPSKPRPIPDPRTADVLAGENHGEGITVSANRTELKRELNNTVQYNCGKCTGYPFGSKGRGTSQYNGLKLAMDLFDISPRRSYAEKPHNIVIVVTDGADKSMSLARNYSARLKAAPYNALLIEVGISLVCEFDINNTMPLASYLESEGKYAYYNASDFNAVKEVADQLFRPLCNSNYSTDCGFGCKGFCGAGECLCPECGLAEDVCHFTQCNVSGSFTEGCVALPAKYPVEDNACTWWECDPTYVNSSAEQNGRWVDKHDECLAEETENPGTCRVYGCEVDFGGCIVELNQSICRHENLCEEWECTPEGETPDDTATGCRIVRNVTQECVDNLYNTGKSACMHIECTGASTVCADMEVDDCPQRDTDCMTYACVDVGGRYECVGTETAHPANTICTEWACNDNGGWYIAVERTPDYCRAKYLEDPDHNSTCKDFDCDPNLADISIEGGCFFTERPSTLCSYRCTPEDITFCSDLAASISNVSYCVYDFCVAIVEGDNSVIGCASNLSSHETSASGASSVVIQNCLDPESASAKKALDYNQNPKKCYTPTCSYGGVCSVVEIPLPTDWEIYFGPNYCKEPRCVQKGDGSWDWELVESETNRTCVSDACTARECVDGQGCVSQDICASKSTECDSYKCETDSENNNVCNYKNLTAEFANLECMQEICVDGKKRTRYWNCTPIDACHTARCVKGMCIHEEIPPPNDICFNFTCDPVSGNFSATPVCDDGLHCTIDECWNYHSFYECHHDRVDCGEYVDMTGYDCFKPYCKEGNGKYRCIRRLLPNAYIDICGNCIKDRSFKDDDSDNKDDSELFIVCSKSPPEPHTYETLAAATIGMIILGAVIAGGALTTSGAIATKTLVKRVRDARNMAAQCNPLFEGVESEMANPAFAGNM